MKLYSIKDGTLEFKDAESFYACLKKEFLSINDDQAVITEKLTIDNNDKITKIIIPDDVEHLPPSCLKDFKCLEELTAKSVKSLGSYALCGCENLKKADLHPDIQWNDMDYNALYYCTSLTDAPQEVLDKCKADNHFVASNDYKYNPDNKEIEEDELTPLEINLTPDIESLRNECDEIMASDEEFVYDEVDKNKETEL